MNSHRLATASFVVSSTLVALALAFAPTRAAAGACAGRPAIALSLVEPGGSIPIGPDTGPLVELVASERRIGSGDQEAEPLDRLRARGRGGVERPNVRMIAPGLHRLALSSPRAGRYHLTGLEPAANVEMTADPAAAIPAPTLRSARRESTVMPPNPMGRGGGTYVSVSLSLEGSVAPPRTHAILLYSEGMDTSRSALNLMRVEPGPVRIAVFNQGSSSRCGPNLPWGGLPVANTQVAVAWVTSSGQISPLSAWVRVTE